MENVPSSSHQSQFVGKGKLTSVTGSPEELDYVNSTLLKIKNSFQDVRIARRQTRSEAVWDAKENVAIVKRKSGKLLHRFGETISGKLILYPEEALFLLETNRLELLWNDVPFSIEQGYAILLGPEAPENLLKYRAYQKLCAMGFHFKRTAGLDRSEPKQGKVRKIDGKEKNYEVFLPERTSRKTLPDYRLFFDENQTFIPSKLPTESSCPTITVCQNANTPAFYRIEHVDIDDT